MYVCYRADVLGGYTECGCLYVTELTFYVVVLSVDVCVLQSRRSTWLYHRHI